MTPPQVLGAGVETRRYVRLTDTPVEYTVQLREPQTQMIDMTMTVRGVRDSELEVCLPVWRPGKYQVLDPAGGVREVRARTASGRDLTITKRDKSTWIVARPEGADDTVVVSYRVYANSIGDRTRHVDDSHAFLSPSTVFMYAPRFRGRAVKVRIEAPERWEAASGLARDPADTSVFIAPDYDVLVDSPLEIGVHETLAFDVDGVPHEIVIWNPTHQQRTLSAERITRDFAKIVREQRDVFGDLPYRRYVFLIHAYPGGSGGTEHLNSTIMGCSPAALRDEEPFKKFLGLVSHEFFHTWNVKQLRPAGLKPYEYQHENYTDLLWVAEGVTSYYDDLTLARAGLTRPDDYLKIIGDAIDAYRKRPGSAVQSLSESSFDAWVKFNRPSPDAANSTVSFYDKGALVSLLLDMEIRSRTENASSLDSLMRDLYKSFPLTGPGFTQADVRSAAEKLTASDFGEFFAKYVDGAEAIEFGGTLAAAGLELARDAGRKNDDEEAEKEKPYLGMTLESKDGVPSVATALADGPAYAAGIIPGDVVLAVNNQRVRGTDVDTLVKNVKPGERVAVTIFRYDTLRTIEFDAAARPAGKWTLRRAKDATPEQIAVYESWLKQKWPARPASDAKPQSDKESSSKPGEEKNADTNEGGIAPTAPEAAPPSKTPEPKP